jgi:hypothetical protein
MLETLREGTGELVQSVANEVVPGVVDAIDVDEIVQRLDIQAILERVDLEALLDRVDLTSVIQRIDLEAVLAKVDINAVLERVDVDALLERTELGTVISRSGSALASQAIDMVRSQGVGVDTFIERWMSRLLRRRQPRAASGPPLLVGGPMGGPISGPISRTELPAR